MEYGAVLQIFISHGQAQIAWSNESDYVRLPSWTLPGRCLVWVQVARRWLRHQPTLHPNEIVKLSLQGAQTVLFAIVKICKKEVSFNCCWIGPYISTYYSKQTTVTSII